MRNDVIVISPSANDNNGGKHSEKESFVANQNCLILANYLRHFKFLFRKSNRVYNYWKWMSITYNDTWNFLLFFFVKKEIQSMRTRRIFQRIKKKWNSTRKNAEWWPFEWCNSFYSFRFETVLWFTLINIYRWFKEYLVYLFYSILQVLTVKMPILA